MSLELNVMAQLKDAMKAKDTAALNALRAIKSAILLAKTSGTAEITETDEMKMLQKLVKQRKDAIAIFDQQGRADLADIEKAEVKVIEQFLPQQLSEAEVENVIKEVIEQTGATSAADLGKVMGAVNKQLAGKAEGKLIADIVKKLLN